MDFDYTVTTEKSFDQAVKAVEKETKNAGFRVLYIHDVTATLKEKVLRLNHSRLSRFAMLEAPILYFRLISR